MKRLWILMLLGLGVVCAQAVELEVGIGESQFQKSAPSTWWQNGMPNQFDLRSTSLSIGATGYAIPAVRYHAGYQYLGHVHSDSLATWNGYDPVSSTNRLTRCVGDGDTQEIYATLAPELQSGNWTFAIEGGFGLYRTEFENDANLYPVGPVGRMVHSPELSVTPIFGGSIGYGKTSLVLTWQSVGAHGDQYPSIAAGPVINISLRERF